MKKEAGQVWIRWFYVSNWGKLTPVLRSNVRAYIANINAIYRPEFESKAVWEIVDTNTLRYIKADMSECKAP